MMQDRLQQNEHRLSRLLDALARFDPRRVWRHFKAVSQRLDTILHLIKAESAAQVDRHEKTNALWEKQLAAIGELSENPVIANIAEITEIAQQISGVIATQVDRLAIQHKSQAEEILIAITDSVDMIKSWNLDRWKFQEYEGLLRYLRRQEYFRAIRDGRLAVPRLETDHPVAISSNDTKFPRGSKNDNSIAPRFNHKLYQFLGGTKPASRARPGVRGRRVRPIADRRRPFRGGARGQRLPLAEPGGGVAHDSNAPIYVRYHKAVPAY